MTSECRELSAEDHISGILFDKNNFSAAEAADKEESMSQKSGDEIHPPAALTPAPAPAPAPASTRQGTGILSSITSLGSRLAYPIGWLAGRAASGGFRLLRSIVTFLFQSVVRLVRPQGRSPRMFKLTTTQGLVKKPATESFQPPSIDVRPIERERLLAPAMADWDKHGQLHLGSADDLPGIPDVSFLVVFLIDGLKR